MSLIVHYIANRATSYFFSKFELYVCALLFAEHAPHHYSENIYNFQTFFMPNDNEISEKEIELLPKNFVHSNPIDSWEFIDSC